MGAALTGVVAESGPVPADGAGVTFPFAGRSWRPWVTRRREGRIQQRLHREQDRHQPKDTSSSHGSFLSVVGDREVGRPRTGGGSTRLRRMWTVLRSPSWTSLLLKRSAASKGGARILRCERFRPGSFAIRERRPGSGSATAPRARGSLPSPSPRAPRPHPLRSWPFVLARSIRPRRRGLPFVPSPPVAQGVATSSRTGGPLARRRSALRDALQQAPARRVSWPASSGRRS